MKLSDFVRAVRSDLGLNERKRSQSTGQSPRIATIIGLPGLSLSYGADSSLFSGGEVATSLP
jgi:hypothetical protein